MTTSLRRRGLVARRALAASMLTACALVGTGADAQAVRDVEIHDGAPTSGTLTVVPAVELRRDVTDPFGWDVQLQNGTDLDVELGLTVHHLEVPAAGADNDVPVLGEEVTWAELPRPTAVLRAGFVADLGVGLSPAPTDLPAAIALVASTTGEDVRQVRATLVLWPAGHAPSVSLDLASPTDGDGPRHLLVRDDAGPSVVGVRVRTTAWPAPPSTTDVGPLVLLPGQPRVVEVPDRPGLLGNALAAAVGVDGEEAARATFGQAVEPARAALLAAALLALAGTAALALRHRR